MSMEETIMFVANLKNNRRKWHSEQLKGLVPKEHENEMSGFSPTDTNDLEPSVSVRGIELKLCGKLMDHVRSN
jgi:hypothetical protein